MWSTVIALLAPVRSSIRTWADLEAEILALRHQVAMLQQTAARRPRLSRADRLLWVLLSRVWMGWHRTMHFVQPATVVRWHRRPFLLALAKAFNSSSHRSPHHRSRHPRLIRQMHRANALWAPRIDGELRKLGLEVSQTTVAKYLGPRPASPSPTWRAFLARLTARLDRLLHGPKRDVPRPVCPRHPVT
jgi:hypothetical protein